MSTDNATYPWAHADEPTSLYKNVENLQFIEIEYYFNFMNKSNPVDEEILKSQNTFNEFKTINYTITGPKLKLLSANNIWGPEPGSILQALTSAQKNDMFNLERLETLGDAFLKFAICMYLYDSFETYSEGNLTMVKGKLVGNRNLYYCALAKKIPEMLFVDEFVPNSNSIIPAYAVCREVQDLMHEYKACSNFLYEINVTPTERFSGHMEPENYTAIVEKLKNWDYVKMHTGIEHHLSLQVIGDKTIADVVEALIGVYLKENGIKAALKIIQWFGIIPTEFSAEKLFMPPKDDSFTPNIDPNQFLPLADVIEERIGYKFNNRRYLLQALTHPSIHGITQCYERLEFLGDAILDFLITIHIYETCSNLTPGQLTDLRSALVNNITFACLAVRHGLHTSFLTHSHALQKSIDSFVKFQEERNYVVDSELINILITENDCKLSEHVDVPKTLGDIFESTIGAVYLDCEKDLNKVWEVIYKIMHKEINAFKQCTPKNCIRLLYETEKALPVFYKSSLVSESNVIMVPLDVTVQGKRVRFYGFGNNRKQAKCAGAKQALKYIKGLTHVN